MIIMKIYTVTNDYENYEYFTTREKAESYVIQHRDEAYLDTQFDCYVIDTIELDTAYKAPETLPQYFVYTIKINRPADDQAESSYEISKIDGPFYVVGVEPGRIYDEEKERVNGQTYITFRVIADQNTTYDDIVGMAKAYAAQERVWNCSVNLNDNQIPMPITVAETIPTAVTDKLHITFYNTAEVTVTANSARDAAVKGRKLIADLIYKRLYAGLKQDDQ